VKRPVTTNTGLPFVQVIHDSDHWRGQFQTLVVDQLDYDSVYFRSDLLISSDPPIHADVL